MRHTADPLIVVILTSHLKMETIPIGAIGALTSFVDHLSQPSVRGHASPHWYGTVPWRVQHAFKPKSKVTLVRRTSDVSSIYVLINNKGQGSLRKT